MIVNDACEVEECSQPYVLACAATGSCRKLTFGYIVGVFKSMSGIPVKQEWSVSTGNRHLNTLQSPT